MGKGVARGTLAIYVDVLLLATLLLLWSPRLTGLPLHEWLGLSLGATLIVHLLLSWSWISSGTRRFVVGRNRRAQINYILNWVLFVLIVIEVTSGIAISHVALPFFGIPTVNDRSWRALHNLTLNWALLVLGFHVAMNWRPLVVGVSRHVWSRRHAYE
jgi:uncharacterized protein DUF4405